jgi:hypothetical protein
MNISLRRNHSLIAGFIDNISVSIHRRLCDVQREAGEALTHGFDRFVRLQTLIQAQFQVHVSPFSSLLWAFLTWALLVRESCSLSLTSVHEYRVVSDHVSDYEFSNAYRYSNAYEHVPVLISENTESGWLIAVFGTPGEYNLA